MHTYTVEFRIESTYLIPSNVTTKLGLEPSQVRDVNKPRANTALWAYNGNIENLNRNNEWETLEEGLLYLLEILLPKRDFIMSEFSEYDMYWWCGHFQDSFDGGPSFSVKLLKKLSNFGIPLYLDNYFSD